MKIVHTDQIMVNKRMHVLCVYFFVHKAYFLMKVTLGLFFSLWSIVALVGSGRYSSSWISKDTPSKFRKSNITVRTF